MIFNRFINWKKNIKKVYVSSYDIFFDASLKNFGDIKEGFRKIAI